MVVRMRSTRSHTKNRRSHHALTKGRLTTSKEGAVHPRHKALLDGSPYRGRSVMDISTKRATRTTKAKKRREREEGPAAKKTEEAAAAASEERVDESSRT